MVHTIRTDRNIIGHCQKKYKGRLTTISSHQSNCGCVSFVESQDLVVELISPEFKPEKRVTTEVTDSQRKAAKDDF